METLTNILTNTALVEWCEMEKHATKKGKIKDVLRGIPSSRFWYFWKRNKEALKKSGVTLFAERDKACTGEYRTHKGRSKEVKRKQWTVTVWMNKHNTAILKAAGFTPCADPF